MKKGKKISPKVNQDGVGTYSVLHPSEEFPT